MLIAFVAVVVVGPRDLPRVVRSVSTYLRKARSIARDFQNSLEEVAREAELDDLRKEANDLQSQVVASIERDRRQEAARQAEMAEHHMAVALAMKPVSPTFKPFANLKEILV